MENKSDIDNSLYENGKLRVRKRWPTRRSARINSSFGGEATSKTKHSLSSDKKETSNFKFCKEKRLNGFAEKQECIQVKKEHVSSEEEDTFCAEEDENLSSGQQEQGTSRDKNMGNAEVLCGKGSAHKQRRVLLKFYVGRSKEISEDLRKQVVEAHKNGKGYKKIAKELDLRLSTVQSIVNKWKKFSTVANLPRSGRPTKIAEMEDKSDADNSLCENGLSDKLRMRKRWPTRRTARMSSSFGGETTSKTKNTSSNDKTETSNFIFCEEKRLDGCDGFAEKQGCIQVKKEYVSSGEEETFCAEEDENLSSGQQEQGTSRDKNMGNAEVLCGKDSVHKQRHVLLKFYVGRSKQISEDLRKQVVEAHKNGKGYKRIAKELDLCLSTVQSIVNKWKKYSTVANLPRSGRPTKIGAKGRHTILKHMRENTRVTTKGLKASLARDNINVHESTIRKTMSTWCSWDFTMDEDTAFQE